MRYGFKEEIKGLYEKLGRFYDNSQYDRALIVANEITELTKQDVGKSSGQYALALNNLAVIYDKVGDYDKALPLYTQALAIRKRVLGKYHPQYVASLSNLAGLYRSIGDYSRALGMYQEALNVVRKFSPGTSPDDMIIMNNLAEIYQQRGEYEKAIKIYSEAVVKLESTSGQNQHIYAQIISNLAGIYLSRGERDKAEDLYAKALKIMRSTLGYEHPDVATNLDNLGGIYYAKGEYNMAEALYTQALAIRKKVLGKYHPDYGVSLSNLAILYIATGRYTRALSLEMKVIAIDDRMISQIFSTVSERQRMAFLRVIQRNFYIFLSLVINYFPHSSSALKKAFDLVLKRKAIASEALCLQRDAVMSGRHPELESKFRELSRIRLQLTNKILERSDVAAPSTHDQLRDLNMRKEDLEAELAKHLPELKLEQKLEAATHKMISKTLRSESILVEFVKCPIFDFSTMIDQDKSYWKTAHYLAFVLDPKRRENVQFLDIGSVDLIDRMIADFRSSITQIDNLDRNVLYRGSVLRKAIFDPLKPFLTKTRDLIIAPDGEISTLPFEAIPTGEDNLSFLIDDYRITYISSSREILRFDHPTKPGSEALVAADPDFDLKSSVDSVAVSRTPVVVEIADPSMQDTLETVSTVPHFHRLAGTRLEGKYIARLLNVSPLLGGDVLEARIKACKSPRILHLATQAFFLPQQDDFKNSIEIARNEKSGLLNFPLENPMLRSGLALAGANSWLKGEPVPEDAEDGLLTAEDVSGLDLSNTELVVLSAPETGLGLIKIGEGVFGLRRAFELAGADTIVMSLWKVHDMITQQLMRYFYENLKKGATRSHALRDAKLHIKKEYDHPFFWAAFICQGNPGPISL
jgi:CHAT domain-containing protein/Flp pilus assembly protein TadD